MNLKEAETEVRRIAEEKVKKYKLEWEDISKRMFQIGVMQLPAEVVVTIHVEIHPNIGMSYKLQGEIAAAIEARFDNVKVMEFGNWFQLRVPVVA